MLSIALLASKSALSLPFSKMPLLAQAVSLEPLVLFAGSHRRNIRLNGRPCSNYILTSLLRNVLQHVHTRNLQYPLLLYSNHVWKLLSLSIHPNHVQNPLSLPIHPNHVRKLLSLLPIHPNYVQNPLPIPIHPNHVRKPLSLYLRPLLYNLKRRASFLPTNGHLYRALIEQWSR